MSTPSIRLGLPIPEGRDNHNLENFQNLIKDIDAKVAKKTDLDSFTLQTEQNHQTLKDRFDSNQLVVSKVEPSDTNFWFEDRGNSGLEVSTGNGVNIANAVVSDDEIDDRTKLWFDK